MLGMVLDRRYCSRVSFPHIDTTAEADCQESNRDKCVRNVYIVQAYSQACRDTLIAAGGGIYMQSNAAFLTHLSRYP